MRQEVTIITAFFDIGRENWQGKMQRSNEKYIEYFKFWARIQNKVIIYTEPRYKDQILAIRAEYGLADKTKVMAIDDIYALDNEVYEAMKKALKNPLAREFRTDQNHPEVYNADYNYIMYLKYFFMQKAVNDDLAKGMLAWMDFGYNKGGNYYTNAEDFNFLWTVDMDINKAHIFTFGSFEELWELPIFEVVRTLKVYITGEIVITPAAVIDKFLSLCKRAELSLADCGFSDDDQTVLLMIYRNCPEFFECHQMIDWTDQLKLTADKEFETRKGANLPHKEAKRLAKKYWREGKYKKALKNYRDYVTLKVGGK